MKLNFLMTLLFQLMIKELAKYQWKLEQKYLFLRPSTLSDDQTPTAPVIKHTLDTLEESGIVYDYCCCVYPCNPFLTKKDLIDSFSELVSKNENFCFTVAEYHHPTQRRLRRLKSGLMQFLEPDHELTLTQSLEVHYHDAGQFYWGTDNAWKSGLKMHSDGVGFEIPNWRVVDIDTNNDWIRAENLFKIIEGKE